jgi:hypothetical protein
MKCPPGLPPSLTFGLAPETIVRRILEAAIGDVEKAEWGDLLVYEANIT